MLTDKTKKGGWVIQKVEVSAEVKDCDGNLIDLKKHNIDLKNWPLWEAWEIKTGNAKENQGFPFSDNYEFPSFGTCTKGTITITGTAEFYVGLKLPVDFVPGGAKPAGDLPSTQKNPGKLPGGIGKVDHSLTATWDCCPKGKLEKTKLKLSRPPF